ncbi:DUF6415 family natural product biosynthesis protein [Streptomyces flavofungini]|uniref:DUF6415 family natural product biosynthesis protein n=1 Tax=Streptomyces flavofungini TaxID=68200 RepID=UPI0034DFF472
MHHPTEPFRAGEVELAALIAEATAAGRSLPPQRRLEQLDQRLRVELQRLAAIVQAHADGMNRGGRDWYCRDWALGATRNALRDPLATSVIPAAAHVAELGRLLGQLTGYVGKER